ncbi:MAG: DUF2169 domain-containing protein, partial [Polyangiaceae bacterium]
MGPTNIEIAPLGRSNCAVLPFRIEGQLRAAILVRATFLVAPGRPAVLARPEPLLRGAPSPARPSPDSARPVAARPTFPSDLVPYKPMADIVVVGHARAPQGERAPWLTARLLVARQDSMLLEKRLWVRGPPGAGDSAGPTPIESFPLWCSSLVQGYSPAPTASIV